jgi:hypothetical protein
MQYNGGTFKQWPRSACQDWKQTSKNEDTNLWQSTTHTNAQYTCNTIFWLVICINKYRVNEKDALVHIAFIFWWYFMHRNGLGVNWHSRLGKISVNGRRYISEPPTSKAICSGHWKLAILLLTVWSDSDYNWWNLFFHFINCVKVVSVLSGTPMKSIVLIGI